MRRIPVLADIEHAILVDAVRLLQTKYEQSIREGKREGMRNLEVERRLEAITGRVDPDAFVGLLAKLGDPAPEFLDRIRKGWAPALDAAETRVADPVGPPPGTEPIVAGM